jgi:septum formation protein
MLESLSSHSHSVVTGVTITTLEKQVTFAVNTEVEFAQLSSQEIDDYVHNFTPLDKAGAYGIQEWIGCIGVKNIKGSFYNVMGLPLHRLYEELKNF